MSCCRWSWNQKNCPLDDALLVGLLSEEDELPDELLSVVEELSVVLSDELLSEDDDELSVLEEMKSSLSNGV